jgi:hypothetical protein
LKRWESDARLKKTFGAASQAEANRLADEWLAEQKTARRVYRSQSSGGSAPNERWIVTVVIEREDDDGFKLTPPVVLFIVLVAIFLIFLVTH